MSMLTKFAIYLHVYVTRSHLTAQLQCNNSHLNDGDFPMLLVHASHMCIEVECLLIVAISNTGLHDLRNFKNLQ